MNKHWWSFGVLVLVWVLLLLFGNSVAVGVRQFLNPVQPASFGGEVSAQLPSLPSTEKGIAAFVYSRYPFNFKDEFFINKGVEDGVEVGSAATFNNVFIGEVVAAHSRSARIRTIFDSRLELPVRIGEAQVNAVLEGGPNPRLELVASEISSEDSVYAASSKFPYGILIGHVAEVDIPEGQFFRSANLITPYNPEELYFVVVRESPTSNNTAP